MSGRAASLLQSHSNDSLTVGGTGCRKPNHSKISLYLQGHAAHCSLLMNIAFIPWLLFPLSLFIPFSSSLTYFLPFPFRRCERPGFRDAWGQSMSDQRWLFLRRGRQGCKPTQLHCEARDCVISIIHCSLFPQSIPCLVPLPRSGRKCSLRASPPTTESSEITVCNENKPTTQ